MAGLTADAVVCGAGIAGIACAYELAVRRRVRRVILVDERPPLSLTSDKSTECYRNWWPGPGDAMVRLMNRSIDLLEEHARASGDRFLLNRRGYLYATADPDRTPELVAAAEEAAALGAGPCRRHPGGPAPYEPHSPAGFASGLTGADVITDPALIRERFPYLSPRTVAVLHARRCGWLSAQQLGAYWLEQARAAGARLLAGRVAGVGTAGGRVARVEVATPGGSEIVATPAFVDAAGPFAADVARLVGVELPLVCERHVKISFEDTLGAIGRDAPLIVWADPVELPWSAAEREALAEAAETAHLLRPFPPGVHGRPSGGAGARSVLLYWTYETPIGPPAFPIEWDPHYPEVVLRGMAAMVPALAGYFGRLPRPFVDGGYYTKTRENRPLVGPLGAAGAYVCAGFSGFGIMAAAAAGELLGAHLTGAVLPPYAGAFALERYDDPDYRARLERWPATGQL